MIRGHIQNHTGMLAPSYEVALSAFLNNKFKLAAQYMSSGNSMEVQGYKVVMDMNLN